MKKRLILISSILAVILIFSIGQMIYQSVKYPAILNIEVAPNDAKVKINGQAARAGRVHVKPGSYTVTASRPGFADFSVKASTTKAKAGYAGLILFSNNDSTANWYATHPLDRKLVEAISSKNFDITSTKQAETDPFILKLPFIAPGEEFQVDYGAPIKDSGGRPVIYIHAMGDEAKADALSWIRGQGFDPTKMYIVYAGS